MSVKYELLKRAARAIGLKKHFKAGNLETMLEKKRRQNAAYRIPELRDRELDIRHIQVMGCTVIRMTHRVPSSHANFYIIGGGMVSSPRPASIRNALLSHVHGISGDERLRDGPCHLP